MSFRNVPACSRMFQDVPWCSIGFYGIPGTLCVLSYLISCLILSVLLILSYLLSYLIFTELADFHKIKYMKNAQKLVLCTTAKVVIDIKSFTLLENIVSSPPPIYLPTENGDEMTASRDL